MTAASAERVERDADAHARVESVLANHHVTLVRFARRWTGSVHDAEDVVQRAFEIYLRRLQHVDQATEYAWLKVVVRNEALAVRKARADAILVDGDDLAGTVQTPGASVDERVENDEHNGRSLEALTRLKPDERTALLLKAEGFSYREIGEREGWSYTKVNRAVTEGRRRFRDVLASIDEGRECERYLPTLLALAEGNAESAEVVQLRPHLRHCAACRATVRELHDSRRHRLLLYLPFIAGIAPTRWLGDRVVDSPGSGPELTGIPHAVLHRLQSSDVATSVQISSSGGGRGPALAALMSLCLGGGAGTYCLATGAFPDPVRIVHPHKKKAPKSVREQRQPKPERAVNGAATASIATETTRRPVVVPTATATPSVRKQPGDERTRRRRPPAAASATQEEFGFESPTAGATPPAAQPLAGASSASTSQAESRPTTATGGSTPPPTSGGEFLP